MNSKGEIRRSIVNLNPLIVCTICKGYFIDPVTLVECLHSFCKTCIMKHVEKSGACPICDTVIHKTKPFSSMREDKTLQDIVFKIVPGLHHSEMIRRKKFYSLHPSRKGQVPDVLEQELRHKIFFNQEDKFSLSIQYFDPIHALENGGSSRSNHSGTNGSTSSGPEKNPNKRYLECPGPMQVCHLKKFIAMKYGLNLESFIIDIIYKEDLIPNNYTLIDIAYNYNWKKDHPMQFFYRIFKKSKVLLKRKRKSSRVEEKCNDDDESSSTLNTEEASSPKKWKNSSDSANSSPRGNSSKENNHPSSTLPPKEKTSESSSKQSSSKASLKTAPRSSTSSLPSAKIPKVTPPKEKERHPDPLPKIVVTSKPPPPPPSKEVPPNNNNSINNNKNSLSSNGAPSSRQHPSTHTTSVISKEDKNGGKTLIIRKSPATKPPGSNKLSLSNSSGGGVTAANHHHRPILPKGAEPEVKSVKCAVSSSDSASEVNHRGNSVNKVMVGSNNNNNNNISSSAVASKVPNTQQQASSQNSNLSSIVKSLTAKKQLEDFSGKSPLPSSSSPKPTEKAVVEKAKKAHNLDSVEKAEKPEISTATVVKDPKKSPSAEALAQSIIANYAIAAAAQHVNAAQVLSLGRGGAYDHLLRPPYVKVPGDPSHKPPTNQQQSSSQIPNTNRLQFKVQTSSNGGGGVIMPNSGPNGALNSLFSSTSGSKTDIKSLFGASVKKLHHSPVSKGLNQSIRQIPNPSLLTNKGNNNNAVQKK